MQPLLGVEDGGGGCGVEGGGMDGVVGVGGDGGGAVEGAGRMGDDGGGGRVDGQLGWELMEEVMEVVVGSMEQR